MPRRRRFLHDDSGAVAATYAIAITGLIIVAGAAFDYNRLMALDSELQTAADHAALAAVTQLDEEDGACARAGNAAVELLRNITLMSNDDTGNLISVNGGATVGVSDDACASFSPAVTFYEDAAKTTVATTDETAQFVEVRVDVRSARYAFTSLGGLLGSNTSGIALAGIGSAVCAIPPIMICSPDPSQPFNAAGNRGVGIQATGKDPGNTGSWSPGNFGFLEVGSGQTNELAQAIAFGTATFDCIPENSANNVETGNSQNLYRALNTRFDIRPQGGGALAACDGTSCPAALSVVTDLIKNNNGTTGNQCGLGNQGWQLPPANQRFNPRPRLGTDTRTTPVNSTGPNPLVMSLGRDLCHYTNYGVACSSVNGGYNDRFGNGHWPIGDYFRLYHPTFLPLSNPPTDALGNVLPTATLPHARMTRYETYLWEQSATGPGVPDISNGKGPQRGNRICQLGSATSDRRVLTVAVVSNCASLSGSSTPVVIDEYIDAFLVEPVIDENTEVTRGRARDSIYIEVIGPATIAGGGAGTGGPQTIKRDTPYLIE
ncbi:TadE/TadG family type IV pilus assembly protein [Aurantiacibacter hainanensis]|uniref:TadE/TadG family type IV pilus assembly protein n=1 Tax=Aurantiacibacter hainanensis TaxID=3076114 RepID=UPI0030C702A6